MAESTIDVNPDSVPELTWDEMIAQANSQGGVVSYGTGYSFVGENLQSTNFQAGVMGWQLGSNGNIEANNGNFRGDITGATGTFTGTVTVGSLNIPDSVTADSFHVDTNGNAWWGATTLGSAKASVLKTGAAVFTNIAIGGTTLQYVITNSGIFSFGDGSDGDVTISADTTLSSDKYYENLTVDTGYTLNPGGYRIFVQNTFTLNGTIARNGNDGGDGGNGASHDGGAPGLSGAALADGYLKGSLVGGAGGRGGDISDNGDAGSNGANVANCLVTANGSAGGHGGDSGHVTIGGAAGSGGTSTASNVKLIANWHLATLLDVASTGSTVKFNSSSSAGGGGGGAGGAPAYPGGGGGGGAGSNGGIIAIYAKNIILANGSAITADGGDGGNGGNSYLGDGGSGVGGGGAGGNGGVIIFCYNEWTDNGATITVNKGTKGLMGTTGNQTNAANGNDGSDGTIYYFQLSL